MEAKLQALCQNPELLKYLEPDYFLETAPTAKKGNDIKVWQALLEHQPELAWHFPWTKLSTIWLIDLWSCLPPKKSQLWQHVLTELQKVKTEFNVNLPCYSASWFYEIFAELKLKLNKWPPNILLHACRNQWSTKIITYLADFVDINYTSSLNGTALGWEVYHQGRMEVVSTLVEKGAALEIREQSKTIFLWACHRQNSLPLFQYLVDYCDLEAVNRSGENGLTLYLSSTQQQAELSIVQLFLNRGLAFQPDKIPSIDQLPLLIQAALEETSSTTPTTVPTTDASLKLLRQALEERQPLSRLKQLVTTLPPFQTELCNHPVILELERQASSNRPFPPFPVLSFLAFYFLERSKAKPLPNALKYLKQALEIYAEIVVVKFLLKFVQSQNLENEEHPLTWEIRRGGRPAVLQLLWSFFQPHIASEQVVFFLGLSLEFQVKVEALQLFVQPSTINAVIPQVQQSPLTYAFTLYASLPVLRFLVEQGANVNETPGNLTFLHRCFCQLESLATVRFFIEHMKPELYSHVNNNNMTALDFALVTGRPLPFISLLVLKAKIDPHHRNNKGLTALGMARYYQADPTVLEFLEFHDAIMPLELEEVKTQETKQPESDDPPPAKRPRKA